MHIVFIAILIIKNNYLFHFDNVQQKIMNLHHYETEQECLDKTKDLVKNEKNKVEFYYCVKAVVK